MLKSISAAAFAAAFTVAAMPAHAQSTTPRTHFEAGARAYLKDGASAAIAEWLRGSALEGNTQATSQANSLRQIEDFYGKPESFEVLSENKVSDRSTLVLAVINYQKGPLYTRFQVFRLTSGAWVVTEFRVHTDSTQLFQTSALYGRL